MANAQYGVGTAGDFRTVRDAHTRHAQRSQALVNLPFLFYIQMRRALIQNKKIFGDR